MIKKIATYNLFTFFFSLIHIMFCTFFVKDSFSFTLKIYIFLLPINSLFFLFLLRNKKNKCKYTTHVYILCVIMRLFFSIFIFFYLITYDVSNISFFLKYLIHFIFSYFMIVFFNIIFLLN